MGLLSGGWAAACLATLSSPPGTTSGGLGVVLCCVGIALLVPAVAAAPKLAACAVISVSAARFALTGIGQVRGSESWLTLAGWVGLLLGLLSLYAAFAFELERGPGEGPLSTGRRGTGHPEDQAPDPDTIAQEPAVRGRL
jgi:succinate-acetate transporter protein